MEQFNTKNMGFFKPSSLQTTPIRGVGECLPAVSAPPLFRKPIERVVHFQALWKTSHAIHRTRQRVECFGSGIEEIAKKTNL